MSRWPPLDAARREEVLPYLETLRDRLSIPMVFVSHQFDEVLRLATHVVLMEAGRDRRLRHAERCQPAAGAPRHRRTGSGGRRLDGTVMQVDAQGGMADVQLGRGVLHISVPHVRVGARRMRIQLLARDIILATESPRGLSVRNALEGVITEISPDMSGGPSWSRSTSARAKPSSRASPATRMEALGLRVGMALWVLVKAVSARGHTYSAGTITPR